MLNICLIKLSITFNYSFLIFNKTFRIIRHAFQVNYSYEILLPIKYKLVLYLCILLITNICYEAIFKLEQLIYHKNEHI